MFYVNVYICSVLIYYHDGTIPYTITGRGRGRLGMYLSSFTGGFAGWPKMAIHSATTYPALKGLTTLSGDLVFINSRGKLARGIVKARGI